MAVRYTDDEESFIRQGYTPAQARVKAARAPAGTPALRAAVVPGEVLDLRARVTVAETAAADAQGAVAVLQEQLGRAQEQVAAAGALLDELRARPQVHPQDLQAVSELQAALDTVTGEKSRLVTRLAELEDDNVALCAVRDRLQHELAVAQDQAGQRAEGLLAARAEVTRLAADLADAQALAAERLADARRWMDLAQRPAAAPPPPAVPDAAAVVWPQLTEPDVAALLDAVLFSKRKQWVAGDKQLRAGRLEEALAAASRLLREAREARDRAARMPAA